MDATLTSVIRLWEQGCSQNEICRRLNMSHTKVRQILVTVGAVETEEAKLLRQGKTIDEICEILGKTRHAVQVRIPYSKGMYGQEYPTINALRIRKCRQKKED